MATTDRAGIMRRIRPLLWGMVAIAAGGAGYAWMNRQSAPPPQSSYARSIGGTFSLVDSRRKPVTDQTLKGEPYAIFFGFTRCPDVCPTTLSRMAKLREALGKDGDKFAIVFVSVDHQRDTPADIGQYVTLFGTPIIGLSGDARQIAAAVKSFGVYYEKVPQAGDDYTIDHTATVFLMDREGALSATISHDEGQTTALAKLKQLIA